MEQPPGSLDDLQPQDDSTSNIPTVIDLARKGEDCFLSSTAPDALRMGKSPGWCPNSGTTNAGLQFSETGSSDITLQPGDQIQPDNAFSHTTVTLSYVSRSHVFTTHNSLSRHSPLYSVPPISKFSLHPDCDTDNGLGETSCALNQHYLEQTEESVNLATQTELFHTLSQSQVKPENDGAAGLPQEPLGFNGEVISCDEIIEKPLQEEEEHSVPLQHGRGLENGELDSRSSSRACADSSAETLPPITGEDEERGGSEVLIIMSKKQDSVVVSDSTAAGDLCSLSRDYRSPLEDPVSPSATSLEDVGDVFILPQASSSPSAENSHLETPEEVACDSSSTERSAQPSSGVCDSAIRLDSSDESKQPAHRRKAVLEPLIDLTDDVCVSDVLENEPGSVVPHINGNAKVHLKGRKLPVRTGRGTRLEAIVMNINSSRYNVSGCILSNKKASASQSTAQGSTFSSPERNDTLSVRKGRGKVKSIFSVKTAKRKAVKVNKSKSSNVNTDSCKDSTSDSELFNKTKDQRSSIPPKSPQFARSKIEPVDPPQASILKSKRKPLSQSSPQSAVLKNSKTGSEPLNQPESSVENNESRVSSPPLQAKSPKNSQRKTKSKSPGCEASPSAKTKVARAPKRRRKKHKPCQSSSMFSPKEPEIKLKYVNFKEEKRDVKPDRFSPFIRVERQQASPSLCTVINYPEEVKTQHKKRQPQQAHTSGFISAVIPSTSCLQLGRPSTHSQHQRALVCCLCGHSANAIDLGDLHGPYYPEGYQPRAKTPVSTSGLKEDGDNYSDSDSSACSLRGSGRKCAITPTPWALKQGAQLKQKVLQGRRRWAGDGAGSPPNKQARPDTGSEDVEDWYSPPVLPLEPCEYWLHEDCTIWSAGIFLVKGKVYGLEEAVKVAQETMCSACHHQGATLGCFFKGCPNKYHYRCALESDCVLIEDNFSMKCKKHKNKTFKAPPGSRWDNR